MKNYSFLPQLISILCFVGFFVIQVCVKPSELILTIIAVLVLFIILGVSQIKNAVFEWVFVSRETKIAFIGLV